MVDVGELEKAKVEEQEERVGKNIGLMGLALESYPKSLVLVTPPGVKEGISFFDRLSQSIVITRSDEADKSDRKGRYVFSKAGVFFVTGNELRQAQDHELGSYNFRGLLEELVKIPHGSGPKVVEIPSEGEKKEIGGTAIWLYLRPDSPDFLSLKGKLGKLRSAYGDDKEREIDLSRYL